MVGVVVHQPRHAAGDHQLGHTDHRSARPRACSTHLAARACVGDPRLPHRVVQGMAGAFIFANGPALVADAFPLEQLGVAMGTNSMVAAIGLVIGPVLGGALVMGAVIADIIGDSRAQRPSR